MFENAGKPPQLTSTAGELKLDRRVDGAVPLGGTGTCSSVVVGLKCMDP